MKQGGYDVLSEVFSALSDPTRRELLKTLKKGEATVAELAAPFEMSQPAISRHLKVLEQAGLITRTKRATATLSQLHAKPLKEASDYLNTYQEFWAESYERLDELFKTMETE